MKKYLCTVCGHIYDEDAGDEKTHVAEETAFILLPEKWVCPICGAAKEQFHELNPAKHDEAVHIHPLSPADLTALKNSVICSGFAKACEKQHKPDDAAVFCSLAKDLKHSVPRGDSASFSALQKTLGKELASIIPTARKVAENHHDRGALRALTWVEKVTRNHQALLERHAEEGPALVKDKNVYLCPICGFIFIDTKAPSKCPVCSVPEWKFEVVEVRS